MGKLMEEVKLSTAGVGAIQQGAVSDGPILVVNATSRRGTRGFELAREVLKIPLDRAFLVNRVDEALELIQEETKHGSSLVIVGGGDGTLSACATALVGSGTVLGVLPFGGGNTFARCLGLPLDVLGAVEVIRAQRVAAVDVGRVNGRVFLNSVGLGFSATIAKGLNPQTKQRFGLLAWLLLGARVGWRQRAIRLRLLGAGWGHEFRTHQFVVGNGRYVAGLLRSTPGASISNGQLEIFTLGDGGLATFVRDGLLWLRGQQVDSPTSRYYHSPTLRVESPDGPLGANVDGEILTETPLEIEVLPRTLRVLVPLDYNSHSG